MSSALRFSLLGDSNVKTHMSISNTRDRPLLSDAEVIHCGRLSMLDQSLSSIRPDSNVCVLSCITNFLTSSDSTSSSASLRVEPVLKTVLDKITAAASLRDTVVFLVCPPMYRLTPLWYKSGLPEILQKFSSVFAARGPTIHLMPSFPSPVLESDGVHLTPLSGTDFILHLFDSARDLLAQIQLDPKEKSAFVDEGTRVLGDRVMVLEQDYRHLASRFDYKCAIDSELSDFQENLRNEAFIMIQGLPRLPKLDPKEWQRRARADASSILTKLMGSEVPVLYVQNSTGRGRDSKVLYRVRLESAEISKTVRGKFGYFFSGKKDSRPPEFANISIRNCVTTATLARIAILQLLGKRYSTSNPGSTVQVVGYEPRPLLKITPPEGASDRHTRVYNFVEAIRRLPTSFTPSEIEDLIKRISPKLHGNLKALFVVINDDMLPSRGSRSKTRRTAPVAQPALVQSGSADSEVSESSSDEGEPDPVRSHSASASASRSNKRSAPESGSSSRASKSRK